MARFSEAEIAQALRDLPAWRRSGQALERRFTCRTFQDAVAFVAALAPEADAADHHPDITIAWRTVVVSWSTHSEGGLTVKDVAGARMTDRHWEARA